MPTEAKPASNFFSEPMKIVNRIQHKGYRNRQLKDDIKPANEFKSNTIARIKRADAFEEQSMQDLIILCVGIEKAIGMIDQINLTYNMFQMEEMKRLHLGYLLAFALNCT